MANLKLLSKERKRNSIHACRRYPLANPLFWKPSTTPCAVISKGTTNEQKVIVGTLEDIADKAKEIPTPAIIVVGEVVKLREELKWFEEQETLLFNFKFQKTL